MAIDAFTLIGKIIERAAGKSGDLSGATAVELSEEQRTEMLVETMATQLIRYLGLNGSGSPTMTAGVDEALQRVYEDQLRRNQRLAQALGACDCWGEIQNCNVCGGRGAPGWRRPQAGAFNQLVRPVIAKLKRHQQQPHRGVNGFRLAR